MLKVLISKWQYTQNTEVIYCFQFQGLLYYYKVCPFGAVVSAHFWPRLGGVSKGCFIDFVTFLTHHSSTLMIY